jgi:hypothetical protein
LGVWGVKNPPPPPLKGLNTWRGVRESLFLEDKSRADKNLEKRV